MLCLAYFLSLCVLENLNILTVSSAYDFNIYEFEIMLPNTT